MKNWDIRITGLNQNMTQAKNVAGADPRVYLSLSERPDSSWIRFFEQELSNQPRPVDKWSGSARVEGPNIVFTCPIAEEKIQVWIDVLKPAIQRANGARAKLEREQGEEGHKQSGAKKSGLEEIAGRLKF